VRRRKRHKGKNQCGLPRIADVNDCKGHKAGISTIKRNDRFTENRNCVGKQLLLTFYSVYRFYAWTGCLSYINFQVTLKIGFWKKGLKAFTVNAHLPDVPTLTN
jgi:hypothetical protein